MQIDKKLLSFLLFIYLTNIFSQNGRTYYTDSVKLTKSRHPCDSNELYFPKYIFFENYDYPVYDNLSSEEKTKRKNEVAMWRNKDFSRTLYLFNEQILYSQPPIKEILRLIVIPTFSKPYCITIENGKKNGVLTVKTLTGKGGYSFGPPLTTIKKSLSNKDSNQYLNLFKNSGTLNQKTVSDEPDGWLDGTFYIVEFSQNNKYYVFYRHEDIDESIHEIIKWTLNVTTTKNLFESE